MRQLSSSSRQRQGNGDSNGAHRDTHSNSVTTSRRQGSMQKSKSSPSNMSSLMQSSSSSSSSVSAAAFVAPSTPLSVLPEDHAATIDDPTLDGTTLAGLSTSSSSSPNTPPKKVWERSYRNFLKFKGGSNSVTGSKPASAATAMPPPFLPHRRAQSVSSTSGSSATSSVAASSAASSSFQQSAVSSSTAASAGLARSVSVGDDGKGEGSVRGGKLFANMFHHHSGGGGGGGAFGVSPRGGGSLTGPFSSSSRKVKSMSADELDGTLRRGAEKGAYSHAYSPGSSGALNPRASSSRSLVTTNLTTAAPSAGSASDPQPNYPPPPPPPPPSCSIPASLRGATIGSTLQPRSEGSPLTANDSPFETLPTTPRVTPGVSQPQQSPSSASSSSQPQHHRPIVIAQEDSSAATNTSLDLPFVTATRGSDMKKAFTEFHNSSHTGRDAVSAFLGDEPSYRGKTSSGSNYAGVSGRSGPVAPRPGPGHSLAWTSSHHGVHAALGAANTSTTAAAAASLGSFKRYTSMVELPRVPSESEVAAATPGLLKPPLAPALPPSQPSGKDAEPRANLSSSTLMDASARIGSVQGPDISAAASLSMMALLSRTAPATTLSSSSSVAAASRKPPGQMLHHLSPPPTDSMQHLRIAAIGASARNVRVLKPIQSVEAWQPNRRYLIAPASLAACPLHVLSTLSPGPSRTAVQAHNEWQREHFCSSFGTIVLGKCWMASTHNVPGIAPTHGGRGGHQGSATAGMTTTAWSEAVLVLKQNYLLEYSPDDYHPRASPRGYAHLQFATCTDQDDDSTEFRHVIRLELFGSPCAKSDPRTLQIQLHDSTQRKAWKWCLSRAAQLTIQDLYEYDPNSAATPVLGKGSYSTVYASCRRDDEHRKREVNGAAAAVPRHTCALKVFEKSQYWKMVVKGRERADTMVRETSVQATLTAKCGKVPSFVRIRGFFETSDHVVLELELLEGGTDLFKYISARGVLKEPRAAEVLYDMLMALQAMNRIGLAHRDVKPANVLMLAGGRASTSIGSGPGQSGRPTSSCKLADFGMSTFVGVDGQLRGRCGTPGYVAPEIFTAGVHGGYGNKVDVFSAGVTLYVMLCGYEPFYGETDAELVAANKAAIVDFPEEEWKGISPEAKDLVKQMMHPDPRHRLSPSQALQHKWLDQVRHQGRHFDLDHSTTLPTSEAPSGDACVIS